MLQLSSPAFLHNGKIPSKYTCEGIDCNPELHIKEVPASTISLALIVDDPDVPKRLRKDGMWVHWVVFNMDPKTTVIFENSSPNGLIGSNTSNFKSYQGPCPPDREHRYFFKLYALDTILTLQEGATKEDVEKAMKGHIIEECCLIGLYEKHHMGET